MIKMFYSENKWIPRLVCDACGLDITNAGMAVALHRMKGVENNSLIDVFHVHKGKCDDLLAERPGGQLEGSQEMKDHLWYVCHNAGFTLAEFKKWVAFKELGNEPTPARSSLRKARSEVNRLVKTGPQDELDQALDAMVKAARRECIQIIQNHNNEEWGNDGRIVGEIEALDDEAASY